MRSVSAAALFVAISLVTACTKATPPSEAEIQSAANSPATTPTPPPAAPAAAAPAADAAGADATATTPATATTAAATPGAAAAAKPAVAAGPDLANGQAKMIVCRACHNMTAGGPNGVGPNLFGLTTRPHATAAGYTYSDAFKAANIGTWSDAELNKWLEDPMGMVPGTKMGFPGVKNAKDRADIIGYLDTLK